MKQIQILRIPEVSISSEGAAEGSVLTVVNSLATFVNAPSSYAGTVAATTVNITLSNPGTDVFDGITLTAGQRLLVKNQSSAAQNGIYVFATSSTALTRATDMNQSEEVQNGNSVFVVSGTAFGGKAFIVVAETPVVIGTTAINFAMVGNGTLTSAHLFVGNGSNVASDVAASGDLTLANTGAFTIANSAVTLAKMADITTASLLGRNTAATGVVEVLSASTARTLLGLATGDSVTFGSVSATTFTGALTGNASTATALATARAINGVNFDGTAAITVTAAAGTLTGATLASNVLASSLTSLGTIASLAASAVSITSTLTMVSNNSAVFDGTNATRSCIQYLVGGNSRWLFVLSGDAESSGNAGSYFQIKARSDAGGAIDTCFQIIRAAGGAMSTTRPFSTSDSTDSSSISTGCMILSGGLGVAKKAYFGDQIVLSASNTVSVSVATASTHKSMIVIGGTTYYALLTTVP